MKAVKAVYMPFRRVWLDDHETPDKDSIQWIIGMTAITFSTLILCAVTTFSN